MEVVLWKKKCFIIILIHIPDVYCINNLFNFIPLSREIWHMCLPRTVLYNILKIIILYRHLVHIGTVCTCTLYPSFLSSLIFFQLIIETYRHILEGVNGRRQVYDGVVSMDSAQVDRKDRILHRVVSHLYNNV